MKLALLAVFLALPIAAQTPPADITAITGVLSIESSSFMKSLYGGKVPVLVGNIWLKNVGTEPYTMGASDIYISLSTVNTIPASDAGAALTKVYGNSKLSQAAKIAQIGAGAVGLMEAASSPLTISARALGYLIFGTEAFSMGVSTFQQGQPNLQTLLAGQCDSLFNGMTTGLALIPGGTVSCRIYIAKPDKGYTLPAAIPFQLVVSGPVPSFPLPPAPPVKAVRPRSVASDIPIQRQERPMPQPPPPDRSPVREESNSERILKEQMASGVGYWESPSQQTMIAKGIKQ